MFEHVCPTHLSGLVMSYAALTFSIDPQIHTKDNDTFFQVCPRGVQFEVAINIQIMFVSHYQEVPNALRIQTSWLLGIGENQDSLNPNPNNTVKQLPHIVISTVQESLVMPSKDPQFTQLNGTNRKQMC